ncbi:hypothetical protein SOQ14_03730 [Erythrobacter sp. T5W1-R]|uniref:hypothetical protein n=1 Tax=Erythrobacter sp. T5W1-R TaxID=3101752 RepID=UPI002AFEE5C5|nr:hypothetical protein [Erythrobacter sp. T5W1-R]MEA1618020.1 hypothetical protein [Erythrobacter sp. T5W1-R]
MQVPSLTLNQEQLPKSQPPKIYDCGCGDEQQPRHQAVTVRLRSTGQSPAGDPLFVEQGGPGDSTIGVIVDQIFPNLPGLKAVLESRDLVFVEERGTRYSKPFLTCPEYDAKNIAVAKGEMDYTDPS